MGAGQRPLRGPDFAAVEFLNEGEQPVGGGIDVSGEGGDGGGEGAVVHGGEIVGDGRRKSRHETIDYIAVGYIQII